MCMVGIFHNDPRSQRAVRRKYGRALGWRDGTGGKALLAAAGALILASASAFAARIVERIIARVNNEIITMRMFQREQQKLRAQLSQEYSGAELDAQVREQSKNLLRDLIDQALMVQKAKDLDINVDTDLVRQLDDIRKNLSLPTQDELKQEVEKQGLSWEDFTDNMKRKLLMREVIGREVGGRIMISREDIRKYFEAHKKDFESPGGLHLAQILISTEKRKPEEAEKRAKDALAEIKAGARFAEVAKKYSDDPTASEGGDAGFFKPGTLAAKISEAVSKLDVGETTDLVETSHGFMIFKVLEKVRPGIPAFEEVDQRVQEMLYNEKMQPALRQYLVTLRKESYIYLAPGFVDTGAERPSEAVLAQKGP
jgi:peptidyl-prolyl cis-trans isomerase SurA